MIELKELINSFCSKRDYSKKSIKILNDSWEQILSVPNAVNEWNDASTMLTEKTGDFSFTMERILLNKRKQKKEACGYENWYDIPYL